MLNDPEAREQSYHPDGPAPPPSCQEPVASKPVHQPALGRALGAPDPQLQDDCGGGVRRCNAACRTLASSRPP